MSDELTWASVEELGGMIARGSLSPVELTEHFLRRIESAQPSLRSFVTIAGERALSHAREAEREIAHGDVRGPLHGIPVALKDELYTEGIASTGGSLAFGRFIPDHDGTVAERLRNAGAIIVGKTNLPEFCSWPRSKNRLAGEAVNPWDRHRIPGASSGGSAAAVAAGLVPFAIGGDGGGSIRIPASLCGVVGLFPTPGRVSNYGSYSLVHNSSLGPLARSVRDVALAEAAIAGFDPRDAASLAGDAPDLFTSLKDGVRDLRIGWSPDFGWIDVQPGIVPLVEAAVEHLAALGARVDVIDGRIEHPWGDGDAMAQIQEVVAGTEWTLDDDTAQMPEIDDPSWMWSVFSQGIALAGSPAFRQFCQAHLSLLAPQSQLMFAAEPPVPSPDDVSFQEDLAARFLRLFERFDVLCTPTMSVVAPTAPAGWATPYPDRYMGTNFTFIANLAGCPAASIPCGLLDGMPVGLQVIGPPGDEPTVLQVLAAYQTVGPGPLRPPTVS